jgi:hypothetical protein
MTSLRRPLKGKKEVLVGPPGDMAFLTFYDPLEWRVAAVDFVDLKPTLGFSEHLLPALMSSGAVERVYLFGDWTKVVRQRGDSLTFLDSRVTLIGDLVVELPLEDLGRNAIWKSLSLPWVMGEFGVIFQVNVVGEALVGVLRAWRLSEELPPAMASTRPNKSRVALPPDRWAALGALVGAMSLGSAALAFGDEGLVACLFGKDEDLRRIRAVAIACDA